MKALLTATLLVQAMTVGTFFAFSTFIAPALGRLGPESAVGAMRSINATILGSPFMIVFGLSILLAVALPVADRLAGSGAWNPLLVGSGALYLVGVFGATAFGNVPLNEALRRAPAPDAAAWSAYAGPWLLWNHARTLAGVVSMAGAAWAMRP